MRKLIFFLLISGMTMSFFSCEEYIYTEQTLVVAEDDFYNDYIDYRSASLGLYALQQDLTEQIIILGELRGDLVKTTKYADADLIEIQNFEITEGNEYAAATNFYKLIGACNKIIRAIERNYPEVTEPNPNPSNYTKMYGEALCMRGWAYFNAARIYGKIPYIPEGLTTYEGIADYILNPGSTFYIDTGRYVYNITGLDPIDVSDTVYYPVDTVYIDTINYETYARRFVDLHTVVDNVTADLTERITDVGVEYGMQEGAEDESWQAIIWTESSKQYLLGQMALTIGDINGALDYFEPILYNSEHQDVEDADIRFGLDDRFEKTKWKKIFSSIDINENILTMWYGNQQQQTHELQRLFDNTSTNLYYMQPTWEAIDLWETEWRYMTLPGGQLVTKEELYLQSDELSKCELYELEERGTPGDFYRGYGVSYVYKSGEDIMTADDVRIMLDNKKNEKDIDVQNLMRDMDTLIYKYTYNNNLFDNDGFVHLYRASSVHLYASEIYVNAQYEQNGNRYNRLGAAMSFLNGSYNSSWTQLGVRGRVDLDTYKSDVTYYVLQDPYTNKVIGVNDFTFQDTESISTETLQKQNYENLVLAERGKELAFEGERFYDIVRIAERRGDPAFLANKIAYAKGKYDAQERENIKNKLMNPENWYVPFFISK